MAGRLLLVGELNDDLNELKISFEALGLAVEMAPDGLAGLEKGMEFQPDLVVTEILTSRLSGFELASRIRSGAAGFTAPVVFYTEFYRDEKARRDVLNKYGAVQYFVRPFQKEALKKSVAAHFQDFLSGLPAVAIAERTPEPTSAPEANTPTPQLRRAAAAAEKQPTNSVSGRPVQPGKPGGSSGEVPNRFRSFSPAAESPSSEVVVPEPEAVGAIAEEAKKDPVEVPVMMPGFRAETGRLPTRGSNRLEPSFLLPVEEPSWFGRLLQSTPVRIGAVVIGAALAFYFVRGRFQGGSNEVPTSSQTPVSTQPSSPTQAAAEPPTQQMALPAVSGVPPAQELPVADVAKTETDLAKPPVSSAADLSAKTHSVKKPETADPGATARQRSPALSIQDVTGSGRGPVLKRMKPIQLSPDMLSSLAAKSVVVRVVIDRAGKVTEVAPVNQEGAAVSLPPDALATIQKWEFSRSRRKDAGEAVKYFSIKVQNPRQ